MPRGLRWSIRGLEAMGGGALATVIILNNFHGVAPAAAAFGVVVLASVLPRGRLGDALVRRHAARTAVRVDDFRQLETMAPRTLVWLRGRAHARETVENVSGQSVIAVQQDFLLFAPGGRAWRAYREAACDFELVDGDGRAVAVDVTGAALFFRRRGGAVWLGERELQRAIEQAPQARESLRVNRAKVAEGELAHGDSVEVLGVLGRAVDPHGATGYRDAPTRPVIQSGKTPVVLFGAG